MGTNFYWKNPEKTTGQSTQDEEDSSLTHIGKRSAAGNYCFGCGITLIHNDVVIGFDGSIGNGRNKLVHSGQAGQSDTCPQCGAGKARETLESSAAGLELGFQERPPVPEEQQGVRTCTSFGWAQDPGWVLKKLFELQDDNGTVVIDEYDREYTAREFLHGVLVACPLWFTDSVGMSFT